jgi:hypothetical protein
MVASWLAPFMIGLTIMFLGRAHYVLYVLKRGNRVSAIITWLATGLVVSFWTWQWIYK